jgi:hypothetical protein
MRTPRRKNVGFGVRILICDACARDFKLCGGQNRAGVLVGQSGGKLQSRSLEFGPGPD